MRLLDAHSDAGTIVRAAKLRHDTGIERGTIQGHTTAALRRLYMHIKCARLPNGGEITEVDEHIEEDIRTVDAYTELGVTVHAFGDGSTWDREGISGWGLRLQRWGEVIIEDHGRTWGPAK